MIICLAVSEKDQDLALKNVKWWNELGGCHGHQVLFCWDQRVTTPNREGIERELKQAFDFVHLFPAPARIDGWPEGANYMFRLCATWMATRTRDIPFFMWMEPDAIPTKPGWLDLIFSEYKQAGMLFMGDKVEVHRPEGDVPLHMSGIGIYQNPIYQTAGEAYRAFDVAWDMAAKDQIVPNAHFTKLIEHAWKHPSFTSEPELQTQIRPEAVVFHSSKDGSLIDILLGKRKGKVVTIKGPPDGGLPLPPDLRGGLSEPQVPAKGDLHINRSADTRNARDDSSPSLPSQHGLSGREVGATSLPQPQSEVYAGSSPVQATTDIFIRTYPADYEWLDFCLMSIAKYCTGFNRIWIVSPQPPTKTLSLLLQGFGGQAEWKVMQDETEDGYLAQQITKLYADVINDYQAEYILHIDSDTLFTRPTTPEHFFAGGKLIWYYTPYDQIQTPWQPITEKFMSQSVEYEFMRRLPMMVPLWLYPKLREFCHRVHGRIVSDYVRGQPPRAFSEFNALGAYAYTYHHDRFHWMDTTRDTMVDPVARQFHSWGGLTSEVKDEIDRILRGGQEASRQAHNLESVGSIPTPAIKELPSGTWVLENDQISQWIEQEGRLDHDQNLLPDILKHIRPGDVVVDVGAFIGDHTIAYSYAVGEKGLVYAFEPNPVAFQCLEHNMAHRPNVALYNFGLSNRFEVVPLSGNNGNAGGAYIGTHMKITNVRMHPLDIEIPWKVDFIKIDAEGYEPKVLDGACRLINTYRPKLLVEVNEGALARQGFSKDAIYQWMHDYGYNVEIVQKNCGVDDPLYDILCTPKQLPENLQDGAVAHTQAPSPVASPLTPTGVKMVIAELSEFAQSSPQNKARVMQQLVYAGLKKPNPKKKPKKNALPDKVPAGEKA